MIHLTQCCVLKLDIVANTKTQTLLSYSELDMSNLLTASAVEHLNRRGAPRFTHCSTVLSLLTQCELKNRKSPLGTHQKLLFYLYPQRRSHSDGEV